MRAIYVSVGTYLSDELDTKSPRLEESTPDIDLLQSLSVSV